MTTWKYGVSRHDKFHANWLFYVVLALLLFVVSAVLGIRAASTSGYKPDMTPVHNSSDISVSAEQQTTTTQDNQAIENLEPNPSTVVAEVHTNNSGDNSTQVTVNGTPVDVPEDGSTSQTITNDDGSNVHVSIDSTNSTTESTRGRSRLRLNISSDSTIKQKVEENTTVK